MPKSAPHMPEATRISEHDSPFTSCGSFVEYAAIAGRSCLHHPGLNRPGYFMQEVKNTQRALVRIGYDGLVHKTFRGPQAYARFENEVRVLRHLERRGC